MKSAKKSETAWRYAFVATVRRKSFSSKEKQIWVIREKRIKAEGNNRKRPRKIQRKNEDWKKKRRINKYPVLFGFICPPDLDPNRMLVFCDRIGIREGDENEDKTVHGGADCLEEAGWFTWKVKRGLEISITWNF
jgi:hypothetical protein